MNSTSYNPISPTNSIGLREAMNQTVTEMGAKKQRNQHINILSTDNANINIRENTSSDFKKLFEQQKFENSTAREAFGSTNLKDRLNVLAKEKMIKDLTELGPSIYHHHYH